ncbi:hypothetical protein [Streptomyces sp. NBC_01445]|uniref:hypothetical protein n=1 Tax=Streptomyces sp. NBC_01445 TaxID=2903869 RepID=UPI002DD8B6A1|nr:hypothetical protein [Streptomyces sp. NBC_01445]WSE03778.1 hypothetical protein OG574_10600 [Streptomyces sp. NBC_01445]
MGDASDESTVAVFLVSADGKDWRDVSAPVRSIAVEDHDRLTDKAVVVLDDATGLLADAAFEGLQVRLTLGWRSQYATLFEGEIMSARVVAGARGQWVELTVLDFSFRMSRRALDPAEWRPGERLSEVLERIVGRPEYGIATGRIQPTDDAPMDTVRPTRRAGLNEWEFVLGQAEHQACLAFVEFDGKERSKFYFLPLTTLAEAQPVGELRYNRGTGDLIQFDYERISAAARPLLELSTVDPASGAVVNRSAPPDPPRPALPAPAIGRARDATTAQRKAVEALADVAAAATGRLRRPVERLSGGAAAAPSDSALRVAPDPTRRFGLHGRGVATGTVLLRAKSLVTISGVAPWAEGNWYVTKVNHVFSRDCAPGDPRPGYYTQFTATR